MIKGTKIWWNGRLIDWDDAKVHIVSETFSYGLGVFEGLRFYHTARGATIFRLQDHLARLQNSAKILYLNIPYSIKELMNAAIEVVRANRFDSGYVRPMVFISTYGKTGWDFRKAQVDTAVAVWDWDQYIDPTVKETGLRVKISSIARYHVNVNMTKAKANANYLPYILARAEALRSGFDEALLLDVSGCLAEGPVENVFMVKNECLITPPTTYILEGITRDTVLTLARHKGIPYQETAITRDQLYTADEAFFCGTAAEITPIREIDNIPIGSECPGPVTQKIKTLYFEAALGRNETHLQWLTTV